MENQSVTAPSAAAPTRDELTAAEALLEQKRRAAADYQEGRRNQAGMGTQTAGTGTTTPASGGTPAQGQQKDNEPNRLSDIIGLLGDTIGEPLGTRMDASRGDVRRMPLREMNSDASYETRSLLYEDLNHSQNWQDHRSFTPTTGMTIGD
jgi:hypothetical protein